MTQGSDDPTLDDATEGRDSEPPLAILGQALERPPGLPRSLLPKIQERIYQRTRGRYFRPKRTGMRDPILLALLLALAIAIVAVAAFVVFVPLLSSAP